jgi:hypothetical protein
MGADVTGTAGNEDYFIVHQSISGKPCKLIRHSRAGGESSQIKRLDPRLRGDNEIE